MDNYGDWQLDIYVRGLSGTEPTLPMSYAELERRAEQAMDPRVWSYVAGGAGDERTQRANVDAFDRWGLMPRMLSGVADRDLSIEIFGQRLPTPLLLAPIGVIGLCEEGGQGDLTTARAAAQVGVPMIASTLSQDPLEDVAEALDGSPGWFQLYPPNDRELTESFVRRAELAGFSAIVVTLDTLTLGWRPRDLQIASFPQLRGLCLANYFTDPLFTAKLEVPPEEDPLAAAMYWAQVFGDPRLSWDDLAWLRSLTSLPLVLKGICAPDDARRAIDNGIDGIYCSTHGGRQANGGLPALQCLPGVVAASGDAPVIFDSGVRTGPDVVKAIALGARAVSIGRPYAFGLAVGGQVGIEHVLRSMLAEIDLIMAIDGYGALGHLNREALRAVAS
jgi:lactate 2-monooxygenase